MLNGIHKAAGNLLAEFGATEFQIMAIHGHSSPEARKVYTEGANRTKLAESATQLFAGIDWESALRVSISRDAAAATS